MGAIMCRCEEILRGKDNYGTPTEEYGPTIREAYKHTN